MLPVLGARLVLSAGELGWVGGELLGFDVDGGPKLLVRTRIEKNVELRPLDYLEGRVRAFWGGLHYGYDFRLKLFEGGELVVAPTFGFGFFDLTSRTKRIFPTNTTSLGGRAVAFAITPGLQASFELFETFRLGIEAEIGFTGPRFAVSTPRMDLWERLRLYIGVNVYGVDLTVGARLVAAHIEGDGKAVDIRLPGVDVTLGYRF